MPVAKEDIRSIAEYISGELKSPISAKKLVHRIVASIENSGAFPYANPKYIATFFQPKEEYRKIVVGKFIVFIELMRPIKK